MKVLNRTAATVAGLLALASAVAGASVVQAQEERLIVYGYTVYNDEAKTDYKEYVAGRCGGYGSRTYVIEPFVSTPYYDKEALYYCGSGGPQLLE